MLYLGELNGRQEASWRKSVEFFGQQDDAPRQVALFPDGHAPAGTGADELPVVRVRLSEMSLRGPRQWGACWLGCGLWRQLGLDTFWGEPLPASRKGTRWDLVLQTLVLYRLTGPGSEWRLHRHWFDHGALAELLLEHKRGLFGHLAHRWRDLFDAKCEVLLYDLASNYFESDPPEDASGLRRFGYSRDKRSDCVQVAIALIVTPEGFPLWPRRCCRATPPTTPRSRTSSARSRTSTARPTASGRWTAASRPRRGSSRCAPAPLR